MKSLKIILVILFLFVLLNFIGKVEDGKITTRSVLDIRAVQVIGTSVSIVVDANAPNVFINSPLNKTYNYNNSINLNFTIFDSISEVSKIWYNLDNANNVTITGNTTFGTSEGNHTVYIFANDTFGFLNNSKYVKFFINESQGHNVTNTKFIVLTVSNISNVSDTSSIDLNILNKSDQVNISNIIIEIPTVGKISFIENISIISDISLDDYINIDENLISIDSNNLPTFNKSATLELYSLTFTNPKVLKDGSDCPSTICKINSYSGGNLNFNVTHFTEYSAAEIPTSSVSPSSSSGGGGGGSNTKIEINNIDIKNEEIKIKLKLDEAKSDFLVIENKGKRDITLTLTIDPKIDFLFIEDSLNKKKIDLLAYETKSIELSAHSLKDNNVKEGIYVSKLIIEGSNFKTIIPIVVEVGSSGPILFDIELNIPKEYLYVKQGGRLITNIKLFNLGITGIINAKIDYEIVDLDGNVILKDSEIQGVETQFQKIKEFVLPQEMKDGKYVISAKVTYQDGTKERVSTATFFFNVGEKSASPLKINIDIYMIIIFILFIIAIIFVTYHFGISKTIKHIYPKRKK